MIQKSESALTVFGDNSRKRFHPIVVAVILECIQNPPSSQGKLIIDTNLQMEPVIEQLSKTEKATRTQVLAVY